jgi:hypothetical protein
MGGINPVPSGTHPFNTLAPYLRVSRRFAWQRTNASQHRVATYASFGEA